MRKLTPRQHEVVKWVCRGKTNKEIGVLMELSALTVKNHVQQILKKIGAENRLSLAVIALQRKYIDLDTLDMSHESGS